MTFVNLRWELSITTLIETNIIDSYKKKFNTIHVGQDFNIDPMVAVVSVIENDKIFILMRYKYFLRIQMK